MYSELMNDYITDVQYFEGFIGAFGSLLSFIYFRRVLKLKNMSIVVGLSFLLTWILRKVLMNIYIKFRNNEDNKYDVNLFNTEFKGVNLYILFIILVTSGLAYNVALKKISYLSKIVYMFFVFFFYLFVKQ
jgi:hypothetical protein